MSDKISVVIPVYNVEEYLERCIESVVNQTYKNLEIILVDDGSPDNCPAMCDEWAEKDSRIKVIHKQNGGLSDARNAGIEYTINSSDSEWITFIDSDDWVHEKYIEALYNAVSDNNCNVSVCSYAVTDGTTPDVNENKLSAELFLPENFYLEAVTNANIAWGKLYKAVLFEEVRYPFGKIHEDVFTTYKLLFPQKTIAFISEPLYFYFRNDKSITKEEWSPKKIDAVDAFSQQVKFFKANNFQNAYILALKALYRNINFNLFHISALGDRKMYKEYYKPLKKKQKKVFKECVKQGILTFQNDKEEYIQVYFKNYQTSKIVWKVKSILHINNE